MFDLDVTLFRTLNGLAGRLEALDALAIFAAVLLLPLLVFLLVPAALTVKRFKEEHWWELPLRAIVAAVLAYGIRWLIGEVAGRPRPFVDLPDVQQLIAMEPAYDSFPSGHAALTFAITFIVLRADRDWGIAFLALAAFVALGRVFVGVHFPLDVLGGAIVGWFAAWIVHKVEHTQWGKLERALRSR